jgi:FAD dependent monooxygenase
MESDDMIGITAEYNCFFGIAQGISGLSPGDSHISYGIDHSSLIFVGTGGICQWFFFSKLSTKHPYASIPRFTKAQIEAQVIEFGDFNLTDKLTLKEVMGKTTSLSYLPLEEANHSVWTWKRIVCLGDAIHKMTPNLGQGGNQAIESAAVLTNCLVEMLARNQKSGKEVGIGEIESSLQKYQSIRQKRSKRFVDLSGALTRNEALATWKNTLRFLYMEPLSGEVMAGEFGWIISKGAEYG